MKFRIAALLCLLISTVSYSQILSDFSASDEGWKLNRGGAITTPAFTATGGNPGGTISYASTNFIYDIYYQAPAKFLTNLGLSYNLPLTFDLIVNTAGAENTVGDIIMYGSGIRIFYVMPSKPAVGVWTSYAATLSEHDLNWHYNSVTGPTPTKIQWKAMLSSVTDLEIRAKYLNGAVTTYMSSIDNVFIDKFAYQTPLTVTAISPTNGIPNTTTVTITGTNFDVTPSQNVVFFGGVKANVISASSTQITAKVPQGAQFSRVKVVNLTTGLSAESPKNFTPLFNNNKDAGGRIIPASFNTKVNLPLDVATNQDIVFATGDVDGDGAIDIVTGEPNKNQFSIFRNLNAGGTITATSFAPKVTFPLAYSGKGATLISDVDGDGKADVLIGASNGASAYIAIFRNTSTPGNLTFDAPQYISASSYADGPIAVADIDGDGRPDLLSTFDNSGGGASAYFTVFPNLSTPGDIEFASYIDFDFNLVGQSSKITIGDLDNDAKLDVAFPSQFDGEFFVYKNTSTVGAFSFQTPFQLDLGGNPHSIVMADFDNDDRLDLAYNGYNTNNILVMKNISIAGTLAAGSFAAPVTLTSPVFANGGRLAAGDFNGDSKIDLVIAGSLDIAVFENNATPGVIDANTFLSGTPYAGGSTFGGPSVADFNGDGKPDFAVNQTGGATPWNIVLYENICYPAPIITTTLPSPGVAGGLTTLTGDLMQTGLITPSVIVRQGNFLANSTVTSMTATTATIPKGAKSDRWSLTTHGLTVLSPVFPITFPTSKVIDATSLSAPTVFALGSNVNNVATLADFDDDGKLDVAIVDGFHNGRIFQNTHAAPAAHITSTSLTKLTTIFNSFVSLAPLDIDGDGKPDLTSGYGTFKNASTPGTISFPTAPTGASSTNYFNVAVTGDFNKDGKVDVAGVLGQTYVSVYENRSAAGSFSGTGYFSNLSNTAANLTRPAQNGGIVAADFDNDGNLDIATANPSTNNWSYFRNLGLKGTISASSFAAHVDIAAGVGAYGIAASDFDGDGKTDVAITNNGQLYVSVYKNTSTPGTISFAAAVTFPVVTKGFDIASQDLDGDGKDELVIIHQNSPGSLSILQNKSTPGTILFATAVNFPMTHSPLELGIGDINQDNKPDIVVSSELNLLVYENLIPSVLITLSTQPSDINICSGSQAVFNAAGTGTTNILYRWQRSPITPVGFTDLADGSGISGSGTATLSIDPAVATMGDQFRYRARVSGDFSGPVFTNDAGYTVTTLPAAPVTSGASVCTGATATLSATGASNGSFKWYANPTGGTAIPGEINSTFTTPALTSATTYYVTIVNGTCETARIPVIATIKTCNGNGDSAPVIQTTSTAVDIGGSVTISLNDLISDPDNDLDLSTLTITKQPTSGATATIDGNGNLTIDYTGNNFSGTDQLTIQVCDKGNDCTSQVISIDVGGSIVVYQGVSPDGNGQNDKWIIKNIESLDDAKTNHVSLFNRWGDKVFDVDNYNNSTKVFTGLSTSGGTLPAGVYFYKIVFVSSRKTLTGYLSLKRQ